MTLMKHMQNQLWLLCQLQIVYSWLLLPVGGATFKTEALHLVSNVMPFTV